METIKILEKEIQQMGYKTKIVHSLTNFGESYYLYVTMHDRDYCDDLNSLKIRFSDHSVTNIDRVFNEIHYSINVEYSQDMLDYILFELRFKFERLIFFDKVETFVKEYNTLETPKKRDTDEVISERLNKMGNKIIYTVRRTYNIPVTRYVYKENGRFFEFRK